MGLGTSSKNLTCILCKHQKIYYRAWKRHISDFDEICTTGAPWYKTSKYGVRSFPRAPGCHGDGSIEFGHFRPFLTKQKHEN